VRRAQDDADEMIGQDSFLDVVTNIVGILILLVMVVGMRTSHAVKRASSEQTTTASALRKEQQQDLNETYQAAATAEKDLRDMIHRAVNVREESLMREQERALLSRLVAEAEHDITAQRAKLSGDDQRNFDIRRKRNEAELLLDELTREQVALVSQEMDVEEVQIEPTPLAREVTGDETHVLLADDHVAVVPFKELMEFMREDAEKNLWRLRQEDSMERTLGPVGDFRLRYSIVNSEVVARSRAGTMVAGRFPVFEQCTFLPVDSPIGEPAEEALRNGSQFQQHIERLNPHRTTVTIWTYPGNYDRLRELKRSIRERGFQIAIRPLPPGVPIGASPSGTKSAAE
jgi:hypothetical protein